MKPRRRYSPIKDCFLVPAQDGWIPSVSVSGLSRSNSGHGVPRLASLNERQIVIVSPESGLPAFSSALTIPQHHSLAGGHEACRPLSFKQNNHVSLPHERTLSRFTFQR